MHAHTYKRTYTFMWIHIHTQRTSIYLSIEVYVYVSCRLVTHSHTHTHTHTHNIYTGMHIDILTDLYQHKFDLYIFYGHVTITLQFWCALLRAWRTEPCTLPRKENLNMKWPVQFNRRNLDYSKFVTKVVDVSLMWTLKLIYSVVCWVCSGRYCSCNHANTVRQCLPVRIKLLSFLVCACVCVE